jgi:hypothetical protein
MVFHQISSSSLSLMSIYPDELSSFNAIKDGGRETFVSSAPLKLAPGSSTKKEISERFVYFFFCPSQRENSN